MVKRYFCDFCKKANLRVNAMVKHEKHCTLNPNRECRVCTLINGGHGHDISELTAILPDPTFYLDNVRQFYGGDKNERNLMNEIQEAMPKLIEATDGCPACIMAALRQKKIPVHMADFDFKEQMKEVFKINNQSADHDYY